MLHDKVISIVAALELHHSQHDHSPVNNLNVIMVRNLGPPTEKEPVSSFEDFLAEYKNPSFIVLIYGMTFALVGRDWRKRKWT